MKTKLILLLVLMTKLMLTGFDNGVIAEAKEINIDLQNIEGFSDDFFSTNMADYNIPGAVPGSFGNEA